MRNVILIAAAAAISFTACSSPSDKTTIVGEASPSSPAIDVRVKVAGLDTTVTMTDGKFELTVPVNKVAAGTIDMGEEAALSFISDGYKLTVSKDQSGEWQLSAPRKSLNTALKDIKEWNAEFFKNYNAKISAISDSTGISQETKDSLMEAYYNEANESYKVKFMDVLSGNNDNYLGLLAFRNIAQDFEDDELDSLISTLDSALVANEFVAGIKSAIVARKTTAEGGKFKDFTVTYDGKEYHLSDYVGKGQYVLVDFWASWCGPCKREIPNIKAVYNEFHGKDFNVLSVAVWDKPEESIDTAKAYGVNWDEIVGANDVPTKLYGIQGIPHIILFGPDGTILKRDLRGDDIRAEVAKYVKPRSGFVQEVRDLVDRK